MVSSGKTIFIKGVFLSILGFFGVIFLIIFLVNPYGFYTKSSSFSNATVLANTVTLNNKNNDLLMHRLEKEIENAKSPSVIIGSSRVFTGFKTCNNDTVTKLSKLGISGQESIHLVESAFQNSTTRIVYVELRELGGVRISSSPSFFDFLFGLDSLWVSLITLYNSYNVDKNIDCYTGYGWREIAPENTPKNILKSLGYNMISDQNVKLELFDFMAATSKLCVANQHHKIIFFIAPIYKTLVDFQKLKQDVLDIKESMLSIISNCDLVSLVSYSDFDEFVPAKNDAIYTSDKWYDINHFKPVVGDLFFKKMKSAVE